MYDQCTFAVFVGELESLDEAQGLLDAAANGQVIDGYLAQILRGINDEQTTEGDVFIFLEHAVGLRYLPRVVRQNRNVHRAQTALFPRSVDPAGSRKKLK